MEILNMSVLKLAKGLWEELESHRQSGDAIQQEMVRRADEILRGGQIDAPSVREMLQRAAEKVKASKLEREG
ncbi:conserved protein of unknown function [Pseudomonas putida KT2440]|uniref:Uncharacterized protein n=2 Tax=Pseudomonas TaxID=286 RepID=Q88GL7_PSEPK|nr:conserved protein of unknown function [Pseudomonas putida KT2440]